MKKKHLWLIRHAKSRQDGSTDQLRRLSYRGYEQCIEMGAWLAGVDHPPSHFLCSSSERTTTTAHILNAYLGGVVFRSDAMYTFSLSTLLEAFYEEILVNSVEEISSLAIVGHNYAISDLLAYLSGFRGSKSLSTLGLAELEFTGNWRDLGRGSCSLLQRSKPKVKADERDSAW